MILSDKQILEERKKGNIIIEPFEKKNLGSNSYDVHLSKYIKVYKSDVLDCKEYNKVNEMEVGDGGFVLHPGVVYLGSTIEYTETHNHVPFLEGKSSLGRLGLFIHATAGKGDVGFCNYWTLEMSVIMPTIIYAGMPIGQLIYHTAGECNVPYNKKKSAKYTKVEPYPQESHYYKNFKTK